MLSGVNKLQFISQISTKKRLLAIGLLITFIFVAVLGKLFYIQIIDGVDLQAKALDQWTRDVPIVATRGKVYSANGYEQPISYAYSANGSVSIPDSVTSITGVQTDYFISINRTSLAVLVSQMSGAYYNLSYDVKYVRPKYQEIFVGGQLPEGVTEYPDDYYVLIPAGRVELTEETLTDLLAYNPNSDGSVYNDMYLDICKSLLSQFFNEQSSNMRDASKLLTVVNSARTNIRREDIELHLDTIFTYNTYQLKNCTFYPNSWENTVKYIREADGRYE